MRAQQTQQTTTPQPLGCAGSDTGDNWSARARCFSSSVTQQALAMPVSRLWPCCCQLRKPALFSSHSWFMMASPRTPTCVLFSWSRKPTHCASEEMLWDIVYVAV